jgi:hypothetical protein
VVKLAFCLDQQRACCDGVRERGPQRPDDGGVLRIDPMSKIGQRFPIQ